jgi:hypothetical protein
MVRLPETSLGERPPREVLALLRGYFSILSEGDGAE